MAKRGKVGLVIELMAEPDVQWIMPDPGVMVGSDGWAAAPYGVLDASKPHSHRYPEGIGTVVNGRVVVSKGENTGVLPGRRLRRADAGQTPSPFGSPPGRLPRSAPVAGARVQGI